MSAAKRPLTLATVLAAAGVATTLTLPGGIAFADTNPPPANLGNSSIASGNQVAAPVSVPVNVCGIAIAILGDSNAGCEGGATATVPQAAPGQGGTGVGSGNNVSAPVSVPVDVCGVSVAVLGSSQSGCQGTSTVGTGPGNPGSSPPPSWPPSGPPGGKPPGGGHHHKPPKHHHHPPGGHHGGGGGGNHGGGNGGHHGGTSGHGKSTGTGTTTLTTTSSSQSGNGQSGASLSSGTLPTTGINLLGILIAAIGSLIAGAAALVTSRRRSAQEA